MKRSTGLATRRGVTLIELMVVIAIVIIVTASSAIAIGQNGRNTLRSSALEVQSLVDRARQTALAQRSPTCIVVSPADGTFSFYANPSNTSGTSTDTVITGTVVQTVVLRGGVGLPIKRGVTIAGEPLSAYLNKATTATSPHIRANDYIYSNTTRKIRIWFDGFGRPNVDALSNTSTASSDWPGTTWLPTSQRSFGWVMLTVGSGSLAVQVVVYANSGTSELRWIGK